MAKLFNKISLILCVFFYPMLINATNITPYQLKFATRLNTTTQQDLCEGNLNPIKFDNQKLMPMFAGDIYQQQNIHNAISIVCFNNPYASEIAGSVIAISLPILQKMTNNLSSSELLLNLQNNGNENHKLITVKSRAAEQIQLQYTSKDKAGALAAKLIKQIPINVNQSFALSDKGYQIMMINFNSHIRAMDKVPLTLVFEDGSKININAEVRCENFYQ